MQKFGVKYLHSYVDIQGGILACILPLDPVVPVHHETKYVG